MRGVEHVEHDGEEGGQGRYEVEFVANSEDDCDAGERGEEEREGRRERERERAFCKYSVCSDYSHVH